MKSEADLPLPRVIDYSNLPCDTQVKVTLVARPLLTPVAQKLQVRTWCIHEQEHFFASKSFADVRKAFVNAYPDKEVPKKTTIYRLVTKFRTEKVFVCDKCSSSDKTAEITAVPISSSASAATTGYGCKDSVVSLVSSFCT
jgi:hypothetical protein